MVLLTKFKAGDSFNVKHAIPKFLKFFVFEKVCLSSLQCLLHRCKIICYLTATIKEHFRKTHIFTRHSL